MKNLVIFILLFSSSAFADFSAKVIKVIDGDTIQVLAKDNKNIRIRMFGIDAPERGQDYGNKARLHLASLIANKTVIVREKDKDIYNRTLAVIYYRNSNINAKMVKAGYAWAYRYKNKATDEKMLKFEAEAKAQRLGLWQGKNPIEPWVFRKNNN